MADLQKTKSGAFYYGQSGGQPFASGTQNVDPPPPITETSVPTGLAASLMTGGTTTSPTSPSYPPTRTEQPQSTFQKAVSTAPIPSISIPTPKPAPLAEPTPVEIPTISAEKVALSEKVKSGQVLTEQENETLYGPAAADPRIELAKKLQGGGTITEQEAQQLWPDPIQRAQMKQSYGLPLSEQEAEMVGQAVAGVTPENQALKDALAKVSEGRPLSSSEKRILREGGVSEDLISPALGAETPSMDDLSTYWGDQTFSTWEKAGLITFNEETGKFDYNLPEISESVWETDQGKKIMDLAADWAEGADDLLSADRLQATENLANTWRDNWRVISENIAGMGIGSDGAAILMMTMGNRQYMDDITAMNIELLVKKKDFMKQGMDWAIDILKYHDDSRMDAERLKSDYWAGITSSLKHSLSVSEDAMEFMGNLGYKYQELNWLQNKFATEFGLLSFSKVAEAVADGVISADVFGTVFDAARTGDWDTVRTTLEESGMSIETLDWYDDPADFVDLVTVWDTANYVYTIDEMTDAEGNTVYKPRLVMQDIGGKKSIARYENNKQVSDLISQANSQGKKIVSTVEADGTVSHEIGGEAIQVDENGNKTQRAVIGADGTIYYEDTPAGEGVGGEVPTTTVDWTADDALQVSGLGDMSSGEFTVNEGDIINYRGQTLKITSTVKRGNDFWATGEDENGNPIFIKHSADPDDPTAPVDIYDPGEFDRLWYSKNIGESKTFLGNLFNTGMGLATTESDYELTDPALPRESFSEVELNSLGEAEHINYMTNQGMVFLYPRGGNTGSWIPAEDVTREMLAAIEGAYYNENDVYDPATGKKIGSDLAWDYVQSLASQFSETGEGGRPIVDPGAVDTLKSGGTIQL